MAEIRCSVCGKPIKDGDAGICPTCGALICPSCVGGEALCPNCSSKTGYLS
ncbi:MAG TPA: hypothetical protein IAC70_00545 [Candidatus Faecicola pullistercoris]|nr:hypothetical protein [Candidatus Faecicola pullistercoris]